MADKDVLHRFLFENAPVRGELVHLDATWQAVLERSDYPQEVRVILGEMMAAAALLAATIKFKGSITMQAQGDGPISLMVVECSSHGTLRGMAHWDEEVPAGGIGDKLGDGRLVITIDPGEGGERYQGIVALEGETLTDALDHYLARSEQLSTQLWLAADGDRAAGLLLQQLPRESEDSDAWNRFVTLASTLTDEELLRLQGRDVIRRLFHEEDLRLFEPQAMSFRCSCTRERVANALRGLGRDEVMDIVRTEGEVEVHCEFCNQRYGFDAVDAEQLFFEFVAPDMKQTRH